MQKSTNILYPELKILFVLGKNLFAIAWVDFIYLSCAQKCTCNPKENNQNEKNPESDSIEGLPFKNFHPQNDKESTEHSELHAGQRNRQGGTDILCGN